MQARTIVAAMEALAVDFNVTIAQHPHPTLTGADEAAVRKTWNRVGTPCECGCDFRIVDDHVGYWTWSDGTSVAIAYAHTNDVLGRLATLASVFDADVAPTIKAHA